MTRKKTKGVDSDAAAIVSARTDNFQAPDIPSTEEFFATGLALVKETETTPETICAVCTAGTKEGVSFSPLIRITKCGHYAHKKCMVRWATRMDENRDKCPSCNVQLFENAAFNFILFALAQHEGVQVEEELLVDAPLEEFGTTVFTEEDVFKLELKATHALTTSYIRAAKYSGQYASDDIDIFLLYREIEDRVDCLGMPWTKYTSADSGINYSEWKAAIAGHILDQFRSIMPEVVRTGEYRDIERDRRMLLNKAKNERRGPA